MDFQELALLHSFSPEGVDATKRTLDEFLSEEFRPSSILQALHEVEHSKVHTGQGDEDGVDVVIVLLTSCVYEVQELFLP